MKKNLLAFLALLMMLGLNAATGKLFAQTAPTFKFKQESVTFAAVKTSIYMMNYLEKESKIANGKVSWRFEAVGASPTADVKMSYGYFTTSPNDGEYIITASFAGDSDYLPAEDSIRVIVGNGLSGGIPVEKVTPQFAFATNQYDIMVGESENIAVNTNLPEDATIKYSVSPSEGLTVSTAGVCTAQSDGIYTVTATFDGNDTYKEASATTTVVVSSPAQIVKPQFAFAEKQYEINVGHSKDISVVTNLPSDAKITYSVSPTTGLTISTAGVCSAQSEGTYTVTARFAGNDDYEAAEATTTVVVSVDELKAPIFRFKEKTITIPVTTTYVALNSTDVYVREDDVPASRIKWNCVPVGASPSDARIQYGYFYPSSAVKKDGEYIVTISYDGKDASGKDIFLPAEDSMRIIVGNGAPTGKATPEFKFAQTQYDINLGESESIAVATNLPANATITYSVEPSEGITISADGICTAQSTGTYTVTAYFEGNDSYESASHTTTVVVRDPSVLQTPVFNFNVDSIDVDTDVTSVPLFNYIDCADDVEHGKVTWSFTAVDSPEDGISISWGYLSPKANGKYIVTGTYNGNDKYEPKSTSVIVYVGPKNADPVYGIVTPTKTVPEVGSTISTADGLEKIVITFPSIGEDGIDAIDRSEGVYLTLSKGDEIVERIPTSEYEKVFISRNNYSEINVVIPKITTPGHYTLKVPANIVEFQLGNAMAVGGNEENLDDLTEEEKYQRSHNAEYNLYFDVIFTPAFTVSPAVGRVKAEELKKIVLTYPEGTELQENTATSYATPALYHYDEAVIDGQELYDADGNPTGEYMFKKTFISDYEVTFEGNKVILNIVGDPVIKPTPESTAIKYYYVAIPQGYWIAKYQGSTYPVLGQNFERYSVIDETIQEIDPNDLPHLQVAENSAVSIEDMSVLKLSYPEAYSFNAWSESNVMGKRVGYSIGSLRKVADASATYGVTMGDYILVDVDEDNHLLTLALTDNKSAVIEQGIYCVGLNTNLFVLADRSKSALIYFKGYEIDTQRVRAGFTLDDEHVIDAVAPEAEEGGVLTVSHHPHFGYTPAIHYTVAAVDKHADHVGNFDEVGYFKPVVSMSATEDLSVSNINVLARTAGVYSLSLNMKGTMIFDAEAKDVKVTVRPTVESLGLHVNGYALYRNDDGSYMVDYPEDNLRETNSAATSADFGFNNVTGEYTGAKVWYKAISENTAMRAPAAEVSTAGYQLNADGDKINLFQIANGVDSPRFSLIMEQNGVLSQPVEVSLNRIYKADPEVYMFEGNSVFEWSKTLTLDNCFVCAEGASEHLDVTIAPKANATFKNGATRYSAEYMAEHASDIMNADSWLYTQEQVGADYVASASVTDDSITLSVPCSGEWTVTVNVKSGDEEYVLENPIVKDIRIAPSFEGLKTNYYGADLNEGFLFVPQSEGSQWTKENVLLSIDGYLYDVYYNVSNKVAANTVSEEEYYRRGVAPAGYTLYSPTYDAKTGKTTTGVDLSNAYSLSLVLEKNGISTTELTGDNGQGKSFTIEEDVLTSADSIFNEEIDMENAEIYTMSGLRIRCESLTPGMYIVVSSGKSHKVIIK